MIKYLTLLSTILFCFNVVNGQITQKTLNDSLAKIRAENKVINTAQDNKILALQNQVKLILEADKGRDEKIAALSSSKFYFRFNAKADTVIADTVFIAANGGGSTIPTKWMDSVNTTLALHQKDLNQLYLNDRLAASALVDSSKALRAAIVVLQAGAGLPYYYFGQSKSYTDAAVKPLQKTSDSVVVVLKSLAPFDPQPIYQRLDANERKVEINTTDIKALADKVGNIKIPIAAKTELIYTP